MTLFLSASAEKTLGADSQPAVVTTVNRPAINTSRLSWDLVGLGKLVQSGVDNKVVLSYIQNTPPKKKPTADELVYLHELGLSSEAMVALMNAVPAVAAAPLTETQAAATPSAGPVQNTAAVTQAPAVTGNTVISNPAPAPTVVYTQPAPVYVQQPVVTYVEPVPPRVTFGFSFGHFFGHGYHGGHWGGHHGHWGGHHGHH